VKIRPIKPKAFLLVGIGVFLALAWLWIGVNRAPRIKNFKECVAAGYPVSESVPSVCRTPEGKSFIDKIPNNEPLPGKTNLKFETLVSGDNRGKSAGGRSVIRDQETWAKVWDEIHAHVQPRPPLLEVDFNKDMVIYALMGVRPSSGFNTKIENIVLEQDRLLVVVGETSPGPECMTAQVQSNPYHIVRLERSDKPVSFELEKTVKNCQR
jgi:hypothetical protein